MVPTTKVHTKGTCEVPRAARRFSAALARLLQMEGNSDYSACSFAARSGFFAGRVDVCHTVSDRYLVGLSTFPVALQGI